MPSYPRPVRVGEQAPLIGPLAERFSPRAWSDQPVDDGALCALFEAARWAPSWGNEQPWHYVVTRRGTEPHARLVATLSRGNRSWAPAAPVLALGCVRVVRDDGSPMRMPEHDLGQATACLTVQATALGLHVHQMGGFDTAAAARAFSLPDEIAPRTVVAIGHRGDPATLEPEQRVKELRDRKRRPLGEVVWDGAVGVPWTTGS